MPFSAFRRPPCSIFHLEGEALHTYRCFWSRSTSPKQDDASDKMHTEQFNRFIPHDSIDVRTFVLSIHLTPRAQPCGAPSQKEKDRLLLVGSVICTISKPSTCPERFVELFRSEWTCPCHCHTFLLNISCKTSFERNEAVYSSLPTGAPIFWIDPESGSPSPEPPLLGALEGLQYRYRTHSSGVVTGSDTFVFTP